MSGVDGDGAANLWSEQPLDTVDGRKKPKDV